VFKLLPQTVGLLFDGGTNDVGFGSEDSTRGLFTASISASENLSARLLSS
jgi:hypothetical protein